MANVCSVLHGDTPSFTACRPEEPGEPLDCSQLLHTTDISQPVIITIICEMFIAALVK